MSAEARSMTRSRHKCAALFAAHDATRADGVHESTSQSINEFNARAVMRVSCNAQHAHHCKYGQ